MKHLIAGLLLASAPFLTTAAVDDAQLKTAFAQVGLNVSSIADSTVPGLLQVMTDRGTVIEFKAPKEKYAVHVFTDISCGYCRKLHSELQSYLDAGITVRYLAFPRGGLESDTFNSLQSVWCAKDKQKAMNEAKGGAEIAAAKCDSPVAKQFELGHSFGINGTPAIILPDGSIIPGYQSAAQLQQALAQLPKS